MDLTRFNLLKALVRFGGDKDKPNTVGVSLLPSTPFEKKIGSKEADSTEDDSADSTDEFSLQQKKLMQRRKIWK